MLEYLFARISELELDLHLVRDIPAYSGLADIFSKSGIIWLKTLD
jgi:hypothetical protein